MKQLPGNLFFSLLLAIPYIVLFILYILLFCMAVFYKGLRQMLFFTVFIAGIAFMSLILSAIGIHFSGPMPVRLIITPDSHVVQQLLTCALLAGYILVFVYARQARSLRVIIYAWLAFLLFNIFDIARDGYLYFTWVPPVEPKHLPSLTDMLLSHVRNRQREHFLYEMISPLLWVFVSTVCLLKIRMEVKVAVAAAEKNLQ